jgi:hypothetical protein
MTLKKVVLQPATDKVEFKDTVVNMVYLVGEVIPTTTTTATPTTTTTTTVTPTTTTTATPTTTTTTTVTPTTTTTVTPTTTTTVTPTTTTTTTAADCYSISLGHDFSDPFTACNATPSSYNIDTTSFPSATKLYNSSCSAYANVGYYSTAGNYKYWTGSAFIGGLITCPTTTTTTTTPYYYQAAEQECYDNCDVWHQSYDIKISTELISNKYYWLNIESTGLILCYVTNQSPISSLWANISSGPYDTCEIAKPINCPTTTTTTTTGVPTTTTTAVPTTTSTTTAAPTTTTTTQSCASSSNYYGLYNEIEIEDDIYVDFSSSYSEANQALCDHIVHGDWAIKATVQARSFNITPSIGDKIYNHSNCDPFPEGYYIYYISDVVNSIVQVNSNSIIINILGREC